MAKVKGQPLGKISGAVGDVVYRLVDGKNIVCRRPGSFMPGTDRKSVERRMKFALAVKFARAMYSVPELKLLWQNASPEKKHTYNFILRKGLDMVSPTSIMDSAAITPPHKGGAERYGFPISCTTLSATAEGIDVELAAIGSLCGSDMSEETNADSSLAAGLVYVVSLMGPANENFPEILFISGVSESKPLALDKALTFKIALSGRDVESFENYSRRKILLALLALDTTNDIVAYSGTLVSELT